MKKRNLVVINCKNEPIYAEDWLQPNYNIIKFPAQPWQPWMEDFFLNDNKKLSLHKKLLQYKNPDIEITLPKNIMSLLHNWRLMLIKYKDLPDDTLFGESDVFQAAEFDWDCIPWDSDYDAYKPFLQLWQDNKFIIKPDKVEWLDYYNVINNWRWYHSNWFKINCGTHAYIIPKNKRDKIINVFSKYKNPSDIAILNGVKNKDIKVATLNYNAFKQWPHTSGTAAKKVYTGQ